MLKKLFSLLMVALLLFIVACSKDSNSTEADVQTPQDPDAPICQIVNLPDSLRIGDTVNIRLKIKPKNDLSLVLKLNIDNNLIKVDSLKLSGLNDTLQTIEYIIPSTVGNKNIEVVVTDGKGKEGKSQLCKTKFVPEIYPTITLSHNILDFGKNIDKKQGYPVKFITISTENLNGWISFDAPDGFLLADSSKIFEKHLYLKFDSKIYQKKIDTIFVQFKPFSTTQFQDSLKIEFNKKRHLVMLSGQMNDSENQWEVKREYGKGVTVDKFGNIYNCTTDSIFRFNKSGKKIWGRKFSAVEIGTDELGNIYASKDSVTKFSPNGERLWSKTIDESNSIAVTPNGSSYHARGNGLTKIDSDGKILWNYSGNGLNKTHVVAVDQQENIYTAGYDSKKIFFSKFVDDSLLWTKELETMGSNFTGSMAIDANGNIWLTGKFMHFLYLDNKLILESPEDAHGDNGFILKFNPQGEVIFAKLLEKEDSCGNTVSADKYGNVYVAGTESRNSYFIYKFNAKNEIIWSKLDDNIPWTIAVDDEESVYVSGVYYLRKYYTK